MEDIANSRKQKNCLFLNNYTKNLFFLFQRKRKIPKWIRDFRRFGILKPHISCHRCSGLCSISLCHPPTPPCMHISNDKADFFLYNDCRQLSSGSKCTMRHGRLRSVKSLGSVHDVIEWVCPCVEEEKTGG